ARTAGRTAGSGVDDGARRRKLHTDDLQALNRGRDVVHGDDARPADHLTLALRFQGGQAGRKGVSAVERPEREIEGRARCGPASETSGKVPGHREIREEGDRRPGRPTGARRRGPRAEAGPPEPHGAREIRAGRVTSGRSSVVAVAPLYP